jgi:hypothetical protein
VKHLSASSTGFIRIHSKIARAPSNLRIIKRRCAMDFDLHGYHPRDIIDTGVLARMLEQAWEMGETRIRFIHGHGRHRGISVGFVNTNTGFFGLRLRWQLRHNKELRRWIKYTTLDCSEWGLTGVNLKRNPGPYRTALDPDLLPERSFRS